MPDPSPALLFVDSAIIAINKPSGWLVHPAGTDAPDLTTWLESQDTPAHLAPVHRLDLGTSGIVVFAPPDRVAKLTGFLAEGQAQKRYRALVFGTTRPKGTIRRKLQDGRRGKSLEATTRYRTLESFGEGRTWSYLEARPETGRKHQIRRHLQGIGHAIIGDDRYRPRGKPTVPAFPGRLWLHALELEIDGHTFRAPLPDELEAHLEALRSRG